MHFMLRMVQKLESYVEQLIFYVFFFSFMLSMKHGGVGKC